MTSVKQKGISRREGLIGGLGLAAAAHSARAQPVSLRLRAEGSERQLPDRWLGYNTPANYDIPVEEPAFRAAVKAVAPHLLRFPGGTVANYYQPETGQLDFGDSPEGSVYRRYLQQNALPRARRLHPNGVSVEQYIDWARDLDAELIVLPNLETSPIASQAAWFRRMNDHGFRPRLVEMGNEFYLALLMDPVALKIWPDWSTTIRRTKTYVDAIRPYVAKDAKIAVQSASSRFHKQLDGQHDARHDHEVQWDRDMRPEPWFHAVTSHLYPTIEASAGRGSLGRLAANAAQIYPAFLARADEGYDRSIADTVARMPGKEVWITEWGAFEPASTLGDATANFDGMWLHMVTRAMMAQLRHKEVTVSTPHALFAQGNLMSAFRRTDAPVVSGRNDLGSAGGQASGYVPINATGVIAWFAAASRGPDAHYQRLAVGGARRIVASGTLPGESFGDVEACLFRRGRQRTVFVHNAWHADADLDLGALVDPKAKIQAEAVVTPDLLVNLQAGAPRPQSIKINGARVTAPAHSLVRLRWTA